MSERAPNFDTAYRRNQLEPGQFVAEGLRSVAFEIFWNDNGEIARAIAEKMLVKADIKYQVDSMHAYADDVTVRQELKKLGIFVVREVEAQFDYDDPDSGLSIRKGERYLDLHIPPVPEELRTRKAVQSSLDLIRDYIETQELDVKYVTGATYDKMGRVAKRAFGFDLSYPRPDVLPESIVHGVERVYEVFTEAGMNGNEMGIPVLVFKETDRLLQGPIDE